MTISSRSKRERTTADLVLSPEEWGPITKWTKQARPVYGDRRLGMDVKTEQGHRRRRKAGQDSGTQPQGIPERHDTQDEPRATPGSVRTVPVLGMLPRRTAQRSAAGHAQMGILRRRRIGSRGDSKSLATAEVSTCQELPRVWTTHNRRAAHGRPRGLRPRRRLCHRPA